MKDTDADSAISKDVGVPHLRGEAAGWGRVGVVLGEAEPCVEETSLAENACRSDLNHGRERRDSLESVLGSNDCHLPFEYVAIIH